MKKIQIESTAQQHSEQAFRGVFGRAPKWTASAPGRVNVIGEFTDYNGGLVLPMALEQRTLISAAPNRSSTIVIRSDVSAEEVRLNLSMPLTIGSPGHWSNYPKGVVAGFRSLGAEGEGFDAHVSSTVPIGAGLSSSAALLAAMATLVEAAWRVPLDPIRKALLCQAAEHEYARVPCGIMDPYISILGRQDHLLLLDCESNEPSWIPFADPDVAMLILNSNVKHQLAESAYGKRRAHCEAAARALGVPTLRTATLGTLLQRADQMEEMTVRCARHVIGEIARTKMAALHARAGQWEKLGQLMYASHESMRTDYDATCPELDAIVATARQIGTSGGMFGCRLTGGGFGGCAVALITAAMEEPIASRMRAMYLQQFGIELTMFVSRPATGAAIEELAA